MKIRPLAIVMILLLASMAMSGCEDDPLLAPQTGSDEDGGSYGNLSLEESDENNKEKNPELF